MLHDWYTPANAPNSSFMVRPLDNAGCWDYEMALQAGLPAQSLQQLFAKCCRDWKDAPLFGPGDRVAEKFDSMMIMQIDMPIVNDVVHHAFKLSRLTEEERKNLSSQSKSPTTPS